MMEIKMPRLDFSGFEEIKNHWLDFLCIVTF